MQVFLAVGLLGGKPEYQFPFTDCDEAMQFVEWVMEDPECPHADEWEILTFTVLSARRAYDAHRAWEDEE